MITKIAIVHDSLTDFGGAERVLFKLIETFPEADLFTSLANPDMEKMVYKYSKKQISYSKLSNFKLALRYPSVFKPYFYHYYWPSLNLDKYDIVISSSHSFCANWVKVKNTHISYIHTPPRFLYEEFNEMSWLRQPTIKKIFDLYWRFLRKKDQKNINKIDYIITNSKNVRDRIKKYYKRNAKTIYPPIKLAKRIKIRKMNQKTYYLFLSRLVKQKGIELVIKAFNKNGKSLLVVGTSNQAKKWQNLAKPNIQFLGFVADKKIPKIYAQSKALIYAAIQEDFGMVPIEAMSYGLPIIAYKDGGVKESIDNGKTGLFFKKYNENSLNTAINKFEKMNFKKEDCKNKAQSFSEKKFKKEFLTTLFSISEKINI